MIVFKQIYYMLLIQVNLILNKNYKNRKQQEELKIKNKLLNGLQKNVFG